MPEIFWAGALTSHPAGALPLDLAGALPLTPSADRVAEPPKTLRRKILITLNIILFNYKFCDIYLLYVP